MGHSVPVLRNLEIYLAAFALTLTPGKAGETVRSVYLYPYGVSYPKSIGAFIAERLLDLVAVGAPLIFTAWTAQGTSLYLIVEALGATEAAIVLLLSAAGVGQTDAITASLISRGLTLWLAVGIGVFAMTRTALANQSTRSTQS